METAIVHLWRAFPGSWAALNASQAVTSDASLANILVKSETEVGEVVSSLSLSPILMTAE